MCGGMPALTCYRLRPQLEGVPVEGFDRYIAWEGRTITPYGPVAFADFDAQLYVTTTPAHPPDWAGFFGDSFGELTIPPVRSVSAALLLRLHGETTPYFAFVFGFGGRYLLRNEPPERSYGLRPALNIVYPASDSEHVDFARIFALDSNLRPPNPIPSRGQPAPPTTFV